MNTKADTNKATSFIATFRDSAGNVIGKRYLHSTQSLAEVTEQMAASCGEGESVRITAHTAKDINRAKLRCLDLLQMEYETKQIAWSAADYSLLDALLARFTEAVKKAEIDGLPFYEVFQQFCHHRARKLAESNEDFREIWAERFEQIDE